MFELYKLLEACTHIEHPVVIEDSLLFVHLGIKVEIKESFVNDIYDVYENDQYIETMTVKEILVKYKIQGDENNNQ